MGRRARQKAEAAAARPPRRWIWMAAAALAGAITLAWSNSFSGPFILDDMPAITENRTVQNLSDWRSVLSPPREGQTVSGRPMVNLTLAINWAIGGASVRGYHLFNLLIHILATLALWGLLRRALLLPSLRDRFGKDASWIAFALALAWGVHPLQTESVTYIVQRAESLAGLFYLLATYTFLRAAADSGASSRNRWMAASVVACALGMASKEVMISAPLFILLFDRTLISGSWREAWKSRKGYYGALAATGGVLAWLVAETGTRGLTAGFGLGISTWSYLLTQCRAIVHYLRLVFWPSPLVLDYGFLTEPSVLAVLPQALLLVSLLAFAAVAVWKRSPMGVPAAAFFLLLAPSSSIVPVATQTMAEHRMYLPLAAVLMVVVGGIHARVGRAAVAATLAASVVLAGVTHRRNQDYSSELAIWQDTAHKAPGNARAYQEWGNALLHVGRTAESIAAHRRALALKPDYPKAEHNLASALCEAGRWEEAIPPYEIAIRKLPDLAEPSYGLGNVMAQLGRFPEAVACYQRALQIAPDFYRAHNNLGNVLSTLGRNGEALAHYDAAVKCNPTFAGGHVNAANLLARMERYPEAIARYEAGLRLDPNLPDARCDLGVLYLTVGRRADGIRALRETLRLAPDHAIAKKNLAAALEGETTPTIQP